MALKLKRMPLPDGEEVASLKEAYKIAEDIGFPVVVKPLVGHQGKGISTNSAFWGFVIHALINIGPELAGIIIGVATIDALNEWRQDEQLKKQLILQMGSRHNDVADTAFRALKSYGSHGRLYDGWLYDGSLCNAYLWRANLEEADLEEADLKGADLRSAILKKAWLKNAKLCFS